METYKHTHTHTLENLVTIHELAVVTHVFKPSHSGAKEIGRSWPADAMSLDKQTS